MYIIKKTDKKITDIFDKAWEEAAVANLDIQCEERYTYMPKTSAKMLYSDYGLHVQMVTEEKPLLARFREQNNMVCKDSCMELFIRPNENDMRYLNFEFNPFGTMYFAIRTGRPDKVFPDKDKSFFEVQSYVDDKKWTLQFVIPFAFIDEVYGGHTDKMYGNFFKCGDETEVMHYCSYYPVAPGDADFHRSEYFGEFALEN